MLCMFNATCLISNPIFLCKRLSIFNDISVFLVSFSRCQFPVKCSSRYLISIKICMFTPLKLKDLRRCSLSVRMNPTIVNLLEPIFKPSPSTHLIKFKTYAFTLWDDNYFVSVTHCWWVLLADRLLPGIATLQTRVVLCLNMEQIQHLYVICILVREYLPKHHL